MPNEQIKKLLVNTPQSLSEAEKAQGRANLGAASSADVASYAVLYNTAQDLNNDEKEQARENIGAISASDIPAFTQVQSNWNESDPSNPAYIRNKPSFALPTYTSTEANFSLCVNEYGNGIEWDRRLKARLVDDDGQGSTTSKDISNMTVNLNETAKGLIRVRPAGESIRMAGWLAPDFESITDEGKVLKISTNNLPEWATNPDLTYKAYGSQDYAPLSAMKIDLDDPDGYIGLKLNNDNNYTGYVVAGPYKALLDSGVNGKGNSTTPVYIDSDGTFKTCALFPKTQKLTNQSYTITSADISRGYCDVDMFTFPVPEHQSEVCFMATVVGLEWGPSGTAHRLTDSEVSKIEVWGTRDDDSTIGYMYREIGPSEINNSDSHHAPTHPSDNFWYINACGSTNAGTMKYLTFRFYFASGTAMVAGNLIRYSGQLVQFT